jgi:hypothetical protein
MIELIEITQLAVISLAGIISIGVVIWILYKVLSNK